MSMTELRLRCYYYGLSPVVFLESTLGEAIDYVIERSDYEHKRSGQLWKVMRYQTTVMVNMMMPKGKSIKPEDLFLMDDEKELARPKIEIDDERAVAVFELMDKKFKERWQRQSAALT